MSDHIVRAIAKDLGVRALACVTTGAVQEAARRSSASPIATAALGHGLTAAALLGALLKVQQRVGIKVQGDGPLRKLVAEADAYGRVRGYVAEPHLPWPLPVDSGDIGDALGHRGLLTVIRDVGLKELSEGVVPIQTGNLDSDLVYYLTMSEQLPSLVEIGAKLDDDGRLLAAGGVLIQTMPGQEAIVLAQFADRMDDLPAVDELLAEGGTPGEVLAALFGPVTLDILEQRAVEFHCGCSWAKSEQALGLLDVEDLRELIAEGEAVVDCHFCHERYIYGREVLEEILEKKIASAGGSL